MLDMHCENTTHIYCRFSLTFYTIQNVHTCTALQREKYRDLNFVTICICRLFGLLNVDIFIIYCIKSIQTSFFLYRYSKIRKIRKEFSFGLSIVINVPTGSWNAQNIMLYITKLNHSLKSRIWGTGIVIPNPTTSTMLWCQWSMRWGYRNISKWGCKEWYTFQFWGVRSMHFNQKEMI